MSKRTWSTIRKIIGWLLIGTGITISVQVSFEVNINEPPVPAEALGWAGPEAVEEAREIVASMPQFRIVGQIGDNARKNVRLWHYTKLANDGAHLPNYPQEIGDCVSFGAKNALEYLQARQIYQAGQAHQFRKIFPPYIYGTSRVDVGRGRLGRDDGSVGAWAAKSVQTLGVLPSDAPDVPEYSGAIARQWGSRGVPDKFKAIAREQLVQTVAQVDTAEEARDAICNGYPVTIASNFGTRSIRERDGRMVAKWDSSWAHQMCLVGYDGSGKNAYFYVLNSWGPNAHPQPIDGEPPGGFWITFRDCDKIVRQGDSFAFSDFEGFPANEDLDFTVIGLADLTGIKPKSEGENRMDPLCGELTKNIVYTIAIGLGILGVLFVGMPRRSMSDKLGLLVAIYVGTISFPSASFGSEPVFDLFGVAPLSRTEARDLPVLQNVASFDLFGISVADRTVESNPAAAWLETNALGLTSQGTDAYHRRYLSDRGISLAGLDAKQVERLYAAVYFGQYPPRATAAKPGRWVNVCEDGVCRWVWRVE